MPLSCSSFETSQMDLIWGDFAGEALTKMVWRLPPVTTWSPKRPFSAATIKLSFENGSKAARDLIQQYWAAKIQVGCGKGR
jgi:hypothetical protein